MKRALNLAAILVALAVAVSAAASPRRALLLPIQFSDKQFSCTGARMDSLARSLECYYCAQFRDSAALKVDLAPVVTLDSPSAPYSANTPDALDAQMHRAVAEACRKADPEVDFSLYVPEGKNVVTDILVLVPGMAEQPGRENEDFAPQYFSLTDKEVLLILDGKRIGDYALSCELGPDAAFTGVGTIAHEYAHILSLPDFYDTDNGASGGKAAELWKSVSLMNGGNALGGGKFPPNLCAPELYALGKGKAEKLDTTGAYTLEPIGESGRFFVLSTDTPGEEFLIENRKAVGQDYLIGGCGVLIYHVDRSGNDALWSDYYHSSLTASDRWKFNEVNANPAHQCVELLPCLPDAPHKIFFPQPGHDSFSGETTPAFRYWSGAVPELAVSGVRLAPDGTAHFSLIRPVTLGQVQVFQNAVLLGWNVSEDIHEVDSCVVECLQKGEPLSRVHGSATPSGEWGCEVGNLSPACSYEFRIRVYAHSGAVFSTSTTQTTWGRRKGTLPFIYLPSAGRNPGGSFKKGSAIPLQVVNAEGVVKVDWFFDGRPVSGGSGGFFELPGSGTLRAEVHSEDGSVEVIIKEITVL